MQLEGNRRKNEHFKRLLAFDLTFLEVLVTIVVEEFLQWSSTLHKIMFKRREFYEETSEIWGS